MPCIKYLNKTMSPDRLAIADKANVIIAEYTAKGFNLTLRQLYYQFVARGYLANKQTEYNRLGDIVNDARLLGLIDWDHITDRTRGVEALSTWNSPAEIIAAVSRQFRVDMWATPTYSSGCATSCGYRTSLAVATRRRARCGGPVDG